MMIYPDNFEAKIGFDIIRRELKHNCGSALGISCCDTIRYSANTAEFTLWLELTDEMLHILQSKRELPLDHLFDLREPVKSITAPGTHLTCDQLHQLQRQLTGIDALLSFFQRGGDGLEIKHLRRLVANLDNLGETQHSITQVIDKQGNMRDNASPLLQQLRATLQHTQASVAGIMRRVIATGKAAGFLDSDVQPGVRDGRLVLPVNPANKRKVRGIVHDESATGRTVFIEPEEIVEANNRIRETEGEIAREMLRILVELADEIRPHVPQLLDNQRLLGELDYIRAKARFALDIGGEMPTIHSEPGAEWYHAVHPALALSLREQGKEVVPLDITLSDEQRIVLISGPNAGGKSVCLKTVGVVQYMAQCGVLPPMHSNSHLGTFENIMIDIGDQQSIEDDLSTYSSHLRNMKLMLSKGRRGTMLLIDEFGSGTEPQIGGALAQAILGNMAVNGVMGVITTHYQNLKQFADATAGIVNGAMMYDRGKMTPLFKLHIGYPGSSFAIEIARQTGLPASVIERAEEIVGSDYVNLDKYLLDIVRDRRYWENKRHEIRLKEKRIDAIVEQYNARLSEIAEQQRQIIHDAKAEAREILAKSNARIERTIKEIREMQAERERTRLARLELDDFRRRLAVEGESMPEMPITPLKGSGNKEKKQRKPKPAAKRDTPLQAGDNVVMKGSQTVGTIVSIDEKYAVVAFGSVKMRLEADKIERTNRKEEKVQHSSVSSATLNDMRSRQLSFKPDIDVRGMRADEALQAVTYFIDDAIQFSVSRVRILHGTGTGALREVIRNYLAGVNGVKSYHDEHVQLGGAGITVVDME